MRREAFGANPHVDFMLQYGRSYEMSARTFLGPRDQPQACYGNATHHAVFDDRLTYVEGSVAVYGVPIEHAWLIDADGFVIDPTLTGNRDGRVKEYFGVPFKTEYVRRAVILNKHYGLLDYFYAGKTAPKLYELGLEAGQQWLLDQPDKRRRSRKAVA
jgi:hypothetical protein